MPPERAELLVAWVAFHQFRNETRDPVEFAERTAQILLGIKSRTTVHKLFRSALDSGWLVCAIPARLERRGQRNWGNRYVLGPRARRDRQRWMALGVWLFGERGALRPFQSSGLLLHDAFGRENRWLTLRLLMDRGSQWSTPSEIHEMAGGLLRSESLVGNQLARFVKWGIAVRSSSSRKDMPQFRATATHVDLLGVAEERGWSDSYASLQVSVTNDRLGLSLVTAQIAALKCCYCGSRGDPASGRCELEHLPPRHWTGSSQAGLLLPVCAKCNNAHSHRIKQTERGLIGPSKPRVVVESTEEWAVLSNHSDIEVMKASLFGYVGQAREYRDAIASGRLLEAEIAARKLAPIAQAVRDGTLTVIDLAGGRVRHLTVQPDFLVWLARQVSELLPQV